MRYASGFTQAYAGYDMREGARPSLCALVLLGVRATRRGDVLVQMALDAY